MLPGIGGKCFNLAGLCGLSGEDQQIMRHPRHAVLQCFTQLGQIWLTQGLTALPAARATSINYVQVVFASLWGVLFFAEPVTGAVVLGAACVLGATLISLSARQPR